MTDALHKNRLTLLLIGGLPLTVILLASWLWYYVQRGDIDLVAILGTANRGELVTPPLALHDVVLRNGADQAVELFAADNVRWRILIPGVESCEERCAQQLYYTRQIRTAMGKYRERIERVYLLPERSLARNFPPTLLSEHPGLKVLYTPVASGLWQRLREGETAGSYFLVDPRGWIMMAYPADADGQDIMADLKFLLENSSS